MELNKTTLLLLIQLDMTFRLITLEIVVLSEKEKKKKTMSMKTCGFVHLIVMKYTFFATY